MSERGDREFLEDIKEAIRRYIVWFLIKTRLPLLKKEIKNIIKEIEK